MEGQEDLKGDYVKKYKTRSSVYTTNDIDIVEVEVERETAKSVWIQGGRCSKESYYEKYHDSWDDARMFLLFNLRNKIDLYNQKIKSLKEAEDKLSHLSFSK